MPSQLEGIGFRDSPVGLDWAQIKTDLGSDDFDNGRSPEQLAASFDNSFAVAYAVDGSRCVGTARILADGICNAYLIDVWTFTPYRRRGIASEMIRRLVGRVPGHHVLLVTEHASALYRKLGFDDEPQAAMSMVVGEWLRSPKGAG